ncbi:MAG: (d)CMP kinase [Thermodesulfobacteriota bacterium]
MMAARKSGIIITIDGPSGAGKSTVAQIVAQKLGLVYIDTGAMYRAVALLVTRSGIDADDEEELERLLGTSSIMIDRNSDNNARVLLNNEDVSDKIRTPEISRLSSYLATKRVVRNRLKLIQLEMGAKGNIVAEGRDMGTCVFPRADFKFYLDASIDERARRRWLQLNAIGSQLTLYEIKREIEQRDVQDRERSESPLHPARNAVIIDTTKLSADEVIEMILSEVNN